MSCKGKGSKQMGVIVVVLGIVSILLGVLGMYLIQPEEHNLSRLFGMITGAGTGVLLVAAVLTIRARVIGQEKCEQEEIDRQDERNGTLPRFAGLVGYFTAVALLAVLAFLFVALGYAVPSCFCIGSLYLLALTGFIARKVLEKRM